MGTVVLAALVPARGAAFQLVDGLAVTAIALLFLLHGLRLPRAAVLQGLGHLRLHLVILGVTFLAFPVFVVLLQMLMPGFVARSEEHTSELQSLMRISYAVFCLQKKKH